MRSRLQALPAGSRVMVVGGGLTGIEMAAEAAAAYPQLRLSMVTAGEPGAGLSPAGRAYLREAFGKLGIEVRANTRVQRVKGGTVIAAGARGEEGERIPFDLCIWAGSFEAPPLARDSGLAVNGKGQLVLDPYLRSISHPDIYGAGDSAIMVEDPEAPLRMACSVAMPRGAHVGDNLLALLDSRPQQSFRFGHFVQCISLGRGRGLIQFVNLDDSPSERIVTGRRGAVVKELVCQFAYRSMTGERLFPGSYRWLGRGSGAAELNPWIEQRG